MLGEEDEAVAEEEADRLEVDGRARHQLPGLVAVVEAEREPEQARVERIAHVPFDRERLLAGDEPPAEHQERPDEPDDEDRDDQEGELVTVLPAAELVDDEAREHEHADGAAACDRIASTAETPSDQRYGRRNCSRRTKVRAFELAVS